MKRLHAIIHGKVQGVGYRFHTQREASALGLTGWVRNLADGAVEMTAEGSQENLDKILNWARHGPPSAEVTDIASGWLSATGEFKGFEIRR
jgi:acylphosphatase